MTPGAAGAGTGAPGAVGPMWTTPLGPACAVAIDGAGSGGEGSDAGPLRIGGGDGPSP